MAHQKRWLWGTIIVGAVLLLLISRPHQPLSAQDGDEEEACSILLAEALQVVGTACAEIGQNEACYGHFPITSELQANASGEFESDGDLIEVLQLQSLVTEPANLETGAWGIALLLLQADTPESPATPLTFVLFGDVTLNSEGAVTSDPTTCSITNNSDQNINLRAGPSTNTEIVGTLASGDSTNTNGRDTNGDWLNIQQGETTAWVYAPLISTDCDLATLDTVNASGQTLSSHSTSAFSLETGQATTCNTLPNGLLVRSPEGRRARVIINGVEMVFSSVGFLTAQADQHMTLTVLEGQVEVSADGQTEIITPNTSTTVPLSGLSASGPPTSPQPQAESEQMIIPALNEATTMLNEHRIGSFMCGVVADSAVNLRGGPGTNYGLNGQLESNTEMAVSGISVGADGLAWWQLEGGSWVRSDLVTVSGRCDDIPTVEPPAPPPTTQPSVPAVSGRRVMAVEAFGADGAPLLPIEAGCFEGSAPIVVIPLGTLGYVTGDPQCNRYPVTFDTGQSGWLLADYIQFLE